MKILLFLFTVILLFERCATKKFLLKGQEVYSYSLGNDTAGPSWTYTKYRILKRKTVKITDNSTYLIIKDNPSKDAVHYSQGVAAGRNFPISAISPVPVWKNESIGNAYFSESKDAFANDYFWYREDKTVLQTASVPIKIRPRIRKPELLDSFPSQTETGVNIGFLFGRKIAWNKFRTTANALGQTTAKHSVTGGGIVSVGAADLSVATTRPKIIFPRKSPMITLGGSIVFGFNNVNIGYALGWDHAVGPSASTWVYQGRVWHGVIVSLDLIK